LNKHNYKHLQITNKKLKSIDEWLGPKGKALNLQHLNNFHAIYTLLKEKAQEMYSQGEGLLHCKQYGHKIAGMERLKLHDEKFGDREMIIKWVKVLTFPNENKMRFHCIFFVNIPHWSIKEVKGIYNQCLSLIDRRDLGSEIHYKKYSITIFLAGKQRGSFQYKIMKRFFVKYNTIAINTNRISIQEARYRIFKQLYMFFGKRTYELNKKVNEKTYQDRNGQIKQIHLYGSLRDFWILLLGFRDWAMKTCKSFYQSLCEYKRNIARQLQKKNIIRNSNTFKNQPISECEKIAGREFYNLLASMGVKKQKRRDFGGG